MTNDPLGSHGSDGPEARLGRREGETEPPLYRYSRRRRRLRDISSFLILLETRGPPSVAWEESPVPPRLASTKRLPAPIASTPPCLVHGPRRNSPVAARRLFCALCDLRNL